MLWKRKEEDIVNTTVSELMIILLFPFGLLVAIYGTQVGPPVIPKGIGIPPCLYDDQKRNDIHGLVKVFIGANKVWVFDHPLPIKPPKVPHDLSQDAWQKDEARRAETALKIVKGSSQPAVFTKSFDSLRIGEKDDGQKCQWYATYFIRDIDASGRDIFEYLRAVTATLNFVTEHIGGRL